jgi:K+:H+ antiporter
LVLAGAGAITKALGVEAVLGAFIAGIVLGQSKFQDGRVRSDLESITLTVFAPLFSLPLGCGWI